MNICFAQINPILGDISGNLSKISNAIIEARKNHADIILFPELATIGYPPKDLILKQELVKANVNALQEIKKLCKDITAVVGFVDCKGSDLYNSAAILQDEKIIGVQHKIHLPNYDVFDEKRYFKSGNESNIYKIGDVNVGIAICEDIWLDGPVENLKSLGAQIVLTISASPFVKGKEYIRENNVLSYRCKENKIAIAYCNLVGGQDDIIFDGHSYYFDQNGEKLFEAPSFEEGSYYFDTSNHKLNTRSTINKVNDVEQVYKALILGLKDYFHKNGFKKAVLGLSGGIDSALTASLAVEALGKENVLGITMPSIYSSSGSVDDSIILAKNLGITINTIPIKSVYDSYIHTLHKEFSGLNENIAEENIQARIRGNILMALSNKFGYLVLSTGNKSELAVGYCTLYGDMSGGLAVISDVPKTMVYDIAKYYNTIKGYDVIPRNTIEKPPSAELRPEQKDSDSLPEYEILDAIIDYYVEKDYPKDIIIAKGFEAPIVEKVIRLIKISEYKRYQAALGFKVTSKAFGPGRRMPITNLWIQ